MTSRLRADCWLRLYAVVKRQILVCVFCGLEAFHYQLLPCLQVVSKFLRNRYLFLNESWGNKGGSTAIPNNPFYCQLCLKLEILLSYR